VALAGAIAVDSVDFDAPTRNENSMVKKRTAETNGIRLDLEQRSFYRFSVLATQINRAVTSAYIKQYGRPANGWKIITVLGRFGTQSVSEIHAHTTLEMDKVTRVIDALLIGGIAIREQDKADRRRVLVTLSPKGRRINAQIEDMIGRMEREFLIMLTPRERESLYNLLDKLQLRANQIFTVSAGFEVDA
jgi:DNA-binding MarR family transcriptional regulator